MPYPDNFKEYVYNNPDKLNGSLGNWQDFTLLMDLCNQRKVDEIMFLLNYEKKFTNYTDVVKNNFKIVDMDYAKAVKNKFKLSNIDYVNKNGDTAFSIAANSAICYYDTVYHKENRQNYIQILKLLIKRGCNVNDTSDNETIMNLPLNYACREGDIEIVKLLLESNINVNQIENNGHYSSLLSAIVQNRSKKNQIEIIKLLIHAGVDVNLDCGFGTPLIHASWCSPMLKLLLQAGADVNAIDKRGDTALMRSYIEGIEILIDAKANINLTNKDNDTVLILACKNGNTEIVELLLQANANINHQNNKGNTALMLAVNCPNKIFMNDKEEIIDQKTIKNSQYRHTITGRNEHWFIGSTEDEKSMKVFIKTLYGKVEIVELLLEAGVETDLKNEEGKTALMIARKFERHEIVQIIEEYERIKRKEEIDIYISAISNKMRNTNVTKNILYIFYDII